MGDKPTYEQLLNSLKRAAHRFAEIEPQTPQILALRRHIVDQIKAADPAHYGEAPHSKQS